MPYRVPAGCNNNWAIATGGRRFQYDVTKSFYLGVEFLYQHYCTMKTPGIVMGSVLDGVFSGTNAT